MGNLGRLLVLGFAVAIIRAQDLTGGAQQRSLIPADIDLGEIRGSGRFFNLDTYQGNPVSWREWERWGSCTGSCGVGTQLRRRGCWVRETEIITTVNKREITQEAGISGGSDPNARQGQFSGIVTGDGCIGYAAEIRGCGLVPCVGVLQPWTTWSACSASCGDGSSFRTRSCQGPGECVGETFQSRACSLGFCYAWTSWTTYSGCSTTCGTGQSFRTRQCADPNGKLAPDSSECPDPLRIGAFQSQTCSVGNCYEFTQWSTWSGCSVDCGAGQITRSRRCIDIVTERDAPRITLCTDTLGLGGFQSQPCNFGACYSWTSWTAYSACSSRCGDGQALRTRRCVARDGSDAPNGDDDCPDPLRVGSFQSQFCNLGPCYSWTAWTAYSACSANCGDGQSFRSRRCEASDGTVDQTLSQCRDPLRLGAFQSQSCNLGPCYGFTLWVSWSSCSASCGDGQITRSRRCIEIGTDNDALSIENCDDPRREGVFQSQPCNLGLCYGWTQWTAYSDCSASCGAGQSFRTRQCVASDGTVDQSLSECPDPLRLGAFQSQNCNFGPCYGFTLWIEWSACSATCGDGQITRSRRCVEIGTENDAVSIDSCDDPRREGVFQSQPCNLGLCYSWTDWTAYSACSASCGDGQSFRSRQCVATDGTVDQSLRECPDPLRLGAFQAQGCNLGPCYGFTLWIEWSACSATCGDGQITRSRRCIEIGTDNDALSIENCDDPRGEGVFQTQPCNLGLCYSWTDWTPYSACSASCGDGQSFRSRQCVATDGTVDRSLRECPDPLQLGAFQAQGCNLGRCYGFTLWVSWSSCSATCGDGQITRSRRCIEIGTENDALSINNCDDPRREGVFQSQPCNLGLCYSWTDWTAYSTCSASCGDGQSFRSRQCVATDGTVDQSLRECPDPLRLGAFQSQGCNLGPCYGFTLWIEWSTCSATCGDGQITRSRRCIEIGTDNDALSIENCDDPRQEGVFQTQPCNLGLCYSWTDWTAYSACSASCGDGQSFRSRQCVATDGTVDQSLRECPDPLRLGAFQSQGCNLGLCYGFTLWVSWSSCSATCGDGQITRSRRCIEIGTDNDAISIENCDDPRREGVFQSQPCNLGLCYSWTDWTAYSACSASCGDGRSFRSRQCVATDGTVDRSLRECPDPLQLGAFQAQGCNLGPCYGFTLWIEWSACSATCGDGQITRSRRCIEIGTDNDAASIENCDDPTREGVFQSQPCNLGLCYSWTDWTAYSECSATCGDGQSFRTRRCVASDGTVDQSLRECPDPLRLGAFQSQDCNLKLCYGFTLWIEWSACSATCGDGQITRSRRCIEIGTDNDALSIENCDDPRGEGVFQTQPCNLGLCYSWTDWTAYSACSASCGDGQSFRSRQCVATDGTVDRSLRECPDPLRLGAFQAQGCNLGPCYGFTEWTVWSSCSATCGDGQITRSRRCVDLGTNDDASTITRCETLEDRGAFQSQPCNLGLCYSWTDWTPYSTCSASCDDGQSFRSRQCVATDGTVDQSLSECPDPLSLGAVQSQRCNLGLCYSWSEWTAYSECSATCGSGRIFRTRQCLGSDGSSSLDLTNCPDPLSLGAFRSETCNLGPCFGFTDWIAWSSCSATCGDGQITRTRRCIDLKTQEDAPLVSNCVDPLNAGIFQSEPCRLQLCYSWTEWSSFSQCSASCGDGQSFRTRRCQATDGTVDRSFQECPDPARDGGFQAQQCTLGPCYAWSAWSTYSDCSVTCGTGTVTRLRRCSTDKDATAEDENCFIPGSDGSADTRACQQQKCYFWTNWTPYSACSASCGDGQSFRTRRCRAEDGTFADSPDSCEDPLNIGSFQSLNCNQGPCYRFTQWGAWSKCDAQCGEGSMQRTRGCATVNGQPGPNSGCSNIPTDFIIRARCWKRACPGTFRPWSQWSECSLTCHAGVRVRSRICTAARCIGRAREAQICNDVPCVDPPTGTWTAWSSWSPCTQPCGGTSTQTRVCIGGKSPTDCGRDCEEYRRTKTCTDCVRGGGPFSIGSCQVVDIVKEDCGFPGITSEQCIGRGCCYDDTVGAGIVWCYNQASGSVRRTINTNQQPSPPVTTTMAPSNETEAESMDLSPMDM